MKFFSSWHMFYFFLVSSSCPIMRRNYKLGPKGVINLVTIFFFGLCVYSQIIILWLFHHFDKIRVGDSSNFSSTFFKEEYLYLFDFRRQIILSTTNNTISSRDNFDRLFFKSRLKSSISENQRPRHHLLLMCVWSELYFALNFFLQVNSIIQISDVSRVLYPNTQPNLLADSRHLIHHYPQEPTFSSRKG